MENIRIFPAKNFYLFEVRKITPTHNVQANSIVSACTVYILSSCKLDGLNNKMFV